jgi:outer membrane protein TolC
MKGKLLLTLTGIALLFVSPAKAAGNAADSLKLSLEQAIELALNENLTLKSANIAVERVDYSVKENWYALLPSLNAQAQYTNNIMKPVFFSSFFPGGKMEIGSTNSYTVAGSLQLPIFSMALYKNIQLSELELRSTLESARSSKLDLLTQVKNTFYGIVMLKQSNEVLEQSYNNAKESADNIKRMYEQGMASEYDKIRSEVAVRNLAPAITQAKNALDLSYMQLKILLSLKLDQPLDVTGDIEKYSSDIANFSEDYYDLRDNSTLRSLDLEIDKMNKNIELIDAQKLPVVSGTMSYSLQMQSEEFTFNRQWSNSLSAGLAIQIPIFNKFSINLKRKQAVVGLKQLEFQKSLTNDNLNMAARNSLNEMKRAQDQMFSDREAVKQAQKGYEIAKVRYSTGSGTVLELNDTEVALTNARLNLNQTIYNFLKAKNDFEKVLGREN